MNLMCTFSKDWSKRPLRLVLSSSVITKFSKAEFNEDPTYSMDLVINAVVERKSSLGTGINNLHGTFTYGS